MLCGTSEADPEPPRISPSRPGSWCTSLEFEMSKPPDPVDALLLRLRTMKWQAVGVMSSSANGLAREEAAALVGTLDGIASAIRNNPAPEAVKLAQERIESIARVRDHEPLRRSAGRS